MVLYLPTFSLKLVMHLFLYVGVYHVCALWNKKEHLLHDVLAQ